MGDNGRLMSANTSVVEVTEPLILGSFRVSVVPRRSWAPWSSNLLSHESPRHRGLRWAVTSSLLRRLPGDGVPTTLRWSTFRSATLQNLYDCFQPASCFLG